MQEPTLEWGSVSWVGYHLGRNLIGANALAYFGAKKFYKIDPLLLLMVVCTIQNWPKQIFFGDQDEMEQNQSYKKSE
jgi:hypothetical protein